nr:reverse transcriptase domain-containing protein [Tanacetum cinerariifolium]
MGPSAEEVRGYSSDGSSRSRSRGRPRSAQKHQKSVLRKKGISKSHRPVRSKTRSRSKSKSVKSKPQSVRAFRRKSSSDSGYDTVSDSGSEDLSVPYRQPKPMPFTSRITCFRYHRRAKLPPNVRVYEGNKDLEDHLSIFSAAADLDPKSVDGFEELSNKFLEKFSQQKMYDKDPAEIYDIKRKPNEGLQAFMDRFKAERNLGQVFDGHPVRLRAVQIFIDVVDDSCFRASSRFKAKTTSFCDPSSARAQKGGPSTLASHADLLRVASTSCKSHVDPHIWPATKLLSRSLCASLRPQVPKLVSIRRQWKSSSRAAAGTREATGEGITGETSGDSRDHSSDAGVPTDDGRVWNGKPTRGMSH